MDVKQITNNRFSRYIHLHKNIHLFFDPVMTFYSNITPTQVEAITLHFFILNYLTENKIFVRHSYAEQTSRTP